LSKFYILKQPIKLDWETVHVGVFFRGHQILRVDGSCLFTVEQRFTYRVSPRVLSELHSMVLGSILPEATSEKFFFVISDHGVREENRSCRGKNTHCSGAAACFAEFIDFVRHEPFCCFRPSPVPFFVVTDHGPRGEERSCRGKNPRCSRGSSTVSAAASPLLSCFFGSPWYSPSSSLCPLRKTRVAVRRRVLRVH
jgi:hypothetical protein